MSYSRPGFRASFLHAAAAALIVGGPAIAQPSDPSPAAPVTAAGGSPPAGDAPTMAAQSSFLGQWELDLTRMPADYGPPPKRVTFAFEDVGSGQWLTRIEISAPDDSVRRVAIQYRRDGQAVQSEGGAAYGDSAAFNAPAPNVLVMSIAKDRGLAGVRVYTISADGAEMTESASGVRSDGVPFVRNFHFRRIH